MFQTTLAGPVEIAGIGVHSGRPARLRLEPADAGVGIVFRLPRRRPFPLRWLRGDGPPAVEVPALWSNVAATRLATVLSADGSAPVRTVEHLMSALAGLAVDNAVVVADGPEVPILDGSAAPFVEAIERAGTRRQDALRRVLKVRQAVAVELDGSTARLEPAEGEGLTLHLEIDFPDAAIGRQSLERALSPDTFRREIAPARTFGRARDLKRLRRLGYGRGASLDNAVGVDGARVLNPEGLRFPDEFVRHKMLDAIGDLALAGAPIAGRFSSRKGGHRLNHAVLAALFARPESHTLELARA